MKSPFISPIGLTVLAVISLVSPALAAVSIDWVTVGNPGNTADTRVMNDMTTGYGRVNYAYKIGKYEVTNAQYAEFLNAVDPGGANANGIYNTSMGSDARGGISYSPGAASGSKYTVRTNMGNKPVNYVSWYDAARFTNWMATGNTETGSYTLNGNIGRITKNVGATVYIPSEDEWYKAAYYNPANSSYSLYPMQRNTTPTWATADAEGNISNPGANVSNCLSGADWNGQNGNVTTVGSAGPASASFYGTYDQGGNVREWNDAIIGTAYRGTRGGTWSGSSALQASTDRFGSSEPAYEFVYDGFRIVSVIPEPTSVVLTMLAGGMLLVRRKRG